MSIVTVVAASIVAVWLVGIVVMLALLVAIKISDLFNKRRSFESYLIYVPVAFLWPAFVHLFVQQERLYKQLTNRPQH